MKAYLDIIQRILDTGKKRDNRTGVSTLALTAQVIEHDMSEGFPLLTTKRVFHKGIRAELEFFIKGLTDKRWLQERGVHIWDDWCNPEKVPYGHDEETRYRMREEPDLGPVYGWQWRHFGGNYFGCEDTDDSFQGGVDQLANVVEKLNMDPSDRRMLVTALNPVDIPKMALPPCHWGFQVLVIDGVLDLCWNIRSCDMALGMPFNIASYALLQHLLCLESEFTPGKCVGFIGDAHVYENQIDGLREQLTREPRPLPKVVTKDFAGIFDWKFDDTDFIDYNPHPRIKFEIAV